jgi:hypothetical protein
MKVPALEKPAGVWCEHAGNHPGGGCSIYETRPQACRDFLCSWLTDEHGIFLDGDRPDRIGIVFWVKKKGGRDPVTGKDLNVIVAMEQHQGAALQGRRAREIIDRFRRRGIPVSIGFGDVLRPVQLTREGRLVVGDPPQAEK